MTTLEDVLPEVMPAPDPDFAAELERRMELGFPAEGRTRRLPRIGIPPLRPMLVAGAAAGVTLAALIAGSALDAGPDGRDPDQVVALEEPAPAPLVADSAAQQRTGDRFAEAATDAALEGAELAPSAPIAGGRSAGDDISGSIGDGKLAPGRDSRRVERSAQMTLAADPDDFDGVADSVFAVTARHDGFVLHSSFTQASEDMASGGSFELRLPSARLQQALNDLAAIATVRSRSESGTDVTGAFVSLRDRLTAALAERKGLLRRLELAPTETAAAAIRRRLASVSRKVASLRAQVRGARERTEFATVLVELVDEDAGAPAPGATDDAVDDAVDSLEGILNFLIRALGIVVPVGLVGAVAWFVTSRARRRARERALA